MATVEKYQSLCVIKKVLEKSSMIAITQVEKEIWNTAYEATQLTINNRYFKSRLAHKTPKKAGYFVSIWQKNDLNQNIPFSHNDTWDQLIVNIIDNFKQGQFIFPKKLLAEKGIISSTHSPGKLAFRVYPTWEEHLNLKATQTQKWQCSYFIDLSDGPNMEVIEKLYLQ